MPERLPPYVKRVKNAPVDATARPASGSCCKVSYAGYVPGTFIDIAVDDSYFYATTQFTGLYRRTFPALADSTLVYSAVNEVLGVAASTQYDEVFTVEVDGSNNSTIKKSANNGGSWTDLVTTSGVRIGSMSHAIGSRNLYCVGTSGGTGFYVVNTQTGAITTVSGASGADAAVMAVDGGVVFNVQTSFPDTNLYYMPEPITASSTPVLLDTAVTSWGWLYDKASNTLFYTVGTVDFTTGGSKSVLLASPYTVADDLTHGAISKDDYDALTGVASDYVGTWGDETSFNVEIDVTDNVWKYSCTGS